MGDIGATVGLFHSIRILIQFGSNAVFAYQVKVGAPSAMAPTLACLQAAWFAGFLRRIAAESSVTPRKTGNGSMNVNATLTAGLLYISLNRCASCVFFSISASLAPEDLARSIMCAAYLSAKSG